MHKCRKTLQFVIVLTLLFTGLITNASTISADGKIKNCTVDVTNPSLGQPVNLIVTTDPAVKYDKHTFFIQVVDIKSTRSSENVDVERPDQNESTPTTIHTFYLGSAFHAGIWRVRASTGGNSDDKCNQQPTFNVGGVAEDATPGTNPCPEGICNTAIGEISTDPTAFVGKILTIAIGLAGGIALIIMVYGSIKVLMSGGDPKKLGECREMIVAAVSGLLFLILSVLILRFIGVTFLPPTANPF